MNMDFTKSKPTDLSTTGCSIGETTGNMEFCIGRLLQTSKRLEEDIVSLAMIIICQTTESESTIRELWTRLVMEEISIDGIGEILPTVILTIITSNIIYQLFGYRKYDASLFVSLFEKRYLPGRTGCRTELLLQQHERKMLRDNVRDAILPTDEHGSITRPLGTMGMEDVGTPIGSDISGEHAAHDGNPPVDVEPYEPGQTALIGLKDGNALQLMLVTMVRKRQIIFQPNRDTELHIAQNTHFMANACQGLGLVEAETSSIGRKERW